MSAFIKKREHILAGVSQKFVALMPALLIGFSGNVAARDFFDPAFIRSVGQNDTSKLPDLSIYATQNAQAPGEYRVEVMLNNEYIETTTVHFVEVAKNDGIALVPCLSLTKLSAYGLRLSAFPDLKEDTKGCTNTNIIPDFKAEFNFNTQQLNISIPQAALTHIAQDVIPVEEFDEGITSLLAN